MPEAEPGGAAFGHIPVKPVEDVLRERPAEGPLAAALHVVGALRAEEPVAVGLPEQAALLVGEHVPEIVPVVGAVAAAGDVIEEDLQVHRLAEALHIVPVAEIPAEKDLRVGILPAHGLVGGLPVCVLVVVALIGLGHVRIVQAEGVQDGHIRLAGRLFHAETRIADLQLVAEIVHGDDAAGNDGRTGIDGPASPEDLGIVPVHPVGDPPVLPGTALCQFAGPPVHERIHLQIPPCELLPCRGQRPIRKGR